MLHNMLRAAAGRDRIPTDGLIAWYTMDNISGSTLVDEMGNYDGTIAGATQTSGVIGQALNFDSLSDVVTTGSKLFPDPNAQDWAFSCWAMFDSMDPTLDGGSLGGSYLISQDRVGTAGDFAIFTSVNSNIGKIHYRENNNITPISNSILSASTVYHISVSKSGNTLYCYINGAADGTATISSIYVDSGISGTAIGRRLYDSDLNDNFLGWIDQARIYNRSLTSDEVMQLYSEGE